MHKAQKHKMVYGLKEAYLIFDKMVFLTSMKYLKTVL